jgi:hypothetical protein
MAKKLKPKAKTKKVTKATKPEMPRRRGLFFRLKAK